MNTAFANPAAPQAAPANTANAADPDAVAALPPLLFKRLLPLLVLAYVISFIDRTNIALAKQHMALDLGLSAAADGLGAGLFFLSYALLEVPSNLIMHRVGARFWITRIMITWGLLSAGMAFVQGEASFYVMRLLLGAAEAGLFPGVMLYLTYWFGRQERARATGYFLLGVCIANIVSGPLAGALLELDGLGGWHGWQWMFVIEGLPAVALAWVVWRHLPDGPDTAPWLSPAQRSLLRQHLRAEAAEAGPPAHGHALMQALRDPQTWVAAAVGALWLAGLATTPGRCRGLLLIGLLVMAGGLLIAAWAGPVGAMVGFSLTALMFFVVQSVVFLVPSARLSGPALAGGIALVNTCGLLGGFLGPSVMGLIEQGTGSTRNGLLLMAGLLVLASGVSLLLRWGRGR